MLYWGDGGCTAPNGIIYSGKNAWMAMCRSAAKELEKKEKEKPQCKCVVL